MTRGNDTARDKTLFLTVTEKQGVFVVMGMIGSDVTNVRNLVVSLLSVVATFEVGMRQVTVTVAAKVGRRVEGGRSSSSGKVVVVSGVGVEVNTKHET